MPTRIRCQESCWFETPEQERGTGVLDQLQVALPQSSPSGSDWSWSEPDKPGPDWWDEDHQHPGGWGGPQSFHSASPERQQRHPAVSFMLTGRWVELGGGGVFVSLVLQEVPGWDVVFYSSTEAQKDDKRWGKRWWKHTKSICNMLLNHNETITSCFYFTLMQQQNMMMMMMMIFGEEKGPLKNYIQSW